MGGSNFYCRSDFFFAKKGIFCDKISFFEILATIPAITFSLLPFQFHEFFFFSSNFIHLLVIHSFRRSNSFLDFFAVISQLSTLVRGASPYKLARSHGWSVSKVGFKLAHLPEWLHSLWEILGSRQINLTFSDFHYLRKPFSTLQSDARHSRTIIIITIIVINRISSSKKLKESLLQIESYSFLESRFNLFC